MQLGELQQHQEEFDARGVTVVAISVDRSEDSLGMIERMGLSFAVASDPDLSVIGACALENQGVGEMAIHATYVVAQDGQVVYRKVARRRPMSGEILDANPAAGAALGVARDALIGVEFNAFVPADAQGPWWTSFDTIAEGQENTAFLASLQDREGRRLRLSVSATRYLRSNKTLTLVLARPDDKIQELVESSPNPLDAFAVTPA